MTRPIITRFAPSPTGYLHLGHAYSALLAYDAAREAGGRFLLRIEDIDTTRCRSEFTDAILEDLTWLGLEWEQPVRRQSDHFRDYQQALDKLEVMGLTYPCFCTRKDIQREIKASPSAPHGPDGALYPGTCRDLDDSALHAKKAAPEGFAIRLNVTKAINLLKAQNAWPLYWQDAARGEIPAAPEDLGDVVLARKDTPTSYHLSVTVDDHLQGITEVIRGEDLFHATHIHRLLQELLNYETPAYHHHKLLTDEDGKRFAKRDKSLTLRALRSAGRNSKEIVDQLRTAPESLLGLLEE